MINILIWLKENKKHSKECFFISKKTLFLVRICKLIQKGEDSRECLIAIIEQIWS